MNMIEKAMDNKGIIPKSYSYGFRNRKCDVEAIKKDFGEGSNIHSIAFNLFKNQTFWNVGRITSLNVFESMDEEVEC